MYHDYGWMVFGHGWIMLLWLLILLIAIWLLVRLFSAPRDHKDPAPRSSAMDILDERFARGEIDESEYRQRKAILRDEQARR